MLTLRSAHPLEPIVPYSDADNESLEVPFYDLDPRANGFFATNVHGTNIPGNNNLFIINPLRLAK